MEPREQAVIDRRIGRAVAGVLLGGVLTAAALVLAGGTLFLIKYGSTAPHYAVFQGEPAELRSVRGILARALAGHGRGLILLGLLFLMATPVVRVLVASWGYARAREYRFMVLGAIVLGVLLW
ncbi:MAG: DUF1634 domain-containing protein, partial [Candidatus Eiseniibacteriota bacterium]